MTPSSFRLRAIALVLVAGLALTACDAAAPPAATVDGEHVVRTFSSTARLDDVAGSIRAKGFSGVFEIRSAGWRDRQTIDVETFSGRVELRLPESARASIDFESFSGRLDARVPIALGGVTSRRRISGRIGSSGAGDGTVRVKTFSGNVTVDR